MRHYKQNKICNVLWLLLLRMVRQQQRSALHTVRIKTATYYVKGVQVARRSLMGYLGLCMLRYLLGFGFLLLHFGLLLYLPWTLKEKGLLLLILSGSYMLIASVAFSVLLSQRTWMKVTAAGQVMTRAVQNRPMCNKDDDDHVRS